MRSFFVNLLLALLVSLFCAGLLGVALWIRRPYFAKGLYRHPDAIAALLNFSNLKQIAEIEREWQLPGESLNVRDPILGVRNRPNMTSLRAGPKFDYLVSYSTDQFGYRSTPSSFSLPKLVTTGCSFTFGVGSDDTETFPWKLGESFTEMKVLNTAIPGHGTHQALLQAWKALRQFPDVRLVVYGFIPGHVRRNWLRSSWLKQIKRSIRVEERSGRLAHLGVINHTIGRNMKSSPTLPHYEQHLTQRFIREFHEMTRQSCAHFLLVILPQRHFEPLQETFIDRLRESVGDGEFLDLRGLVTEEDFGFPNDPHPVPQAQARFARAIEHHILENNLLVAPERCRRPLKVPAPMLFCANTAGPDNAACRSSSEVMPDGDREGNERLQIP